MKRKLARIHSRHRRLFISAVIAILYWLGKHSSPRARAHWVGGSRRRRPERLLIAILFLLGMALLSPADFAYWAVLVGGCVAIYLNLYVIYLLIPRKQAHWL